MKYSEEGILLLDKQYLAAQLENGSLVDIKEFCEFSQWYDILESTTCFWKVKPPYSVLIMLNTPVVLPPFLTPSLNSD